MRTDRILNENLRKFLTGNSHTRNFIIRLVRDSITDGTKSVALCFRGDYATLYYRSHQLLRIRSSYSTIIGEFDYRHSRFTKNYQQILEKLNSMGVDIAHFSDEPNQSHRKYVRFDLIGANAVTQEALAEIIQIYKNLIDDFVNPTKTEYAFDPKSYCIKSINLEKDRQQQLYATYFLHDDLLYYDLEYAEHHAVKNGVHGRFDLIGLRREGNHYTLLFTELKSTSSACGGKSGIASHEIDYIKYLNSNFMENRKKEACETIKMLFEIFDKPTPENLTPENINNVKIKFVFSDKAIPVGERYTPQDCRIEKAYICTENGMEKSY